MQKTMWVNKEFLSQYRLGQLFYSSVGGSEMKCCFQSCDVKLPSLLTKCIIMSLEGQLWAGKNRAQISVWEMKAVM